MLNSEKTIYALNDINNSYLESARCMLGYKTGAGDGHIRKTRMLTLALAAALVLGLSALAYAVDLFGFRAILIRDKAPADNPDGGYISFTQPQEVPEEMGASVRRKIENSTDAWAEWMEWSETNGLSFPAVYDPPEGVSFLNEEENEDGSYTIRFYAYPEEPVDASVSLEHIQNGDYSDFILLDERQATKQEHDRNMEIADAVARGYSGYDYTYHVYTKEMADRLESIAQEYGLKLRHKRTVMYQNFDSFTEYSTFEEITDRINEICSGGQSLFRIKPTAYEKFYYFDEGTFAISFYTTDDLSNAGTNCYIYNSPYETMSSGFEIFDEVKDINAFTARTHMTPDGTELTVLRNGADIYAYVYLENSFVTLHVMQPLGLSEEEIDTVLDMINYSSIS